MAHRNRGLPINSMVIFHGKLLVITRWYIYISYIYIIYIYHMYLENKPSNISMAAQSLGIVMRLAQLHPSCRTQCRTQ